MYKTICEDDELFIEKKWGDIPGLTKTVDTEEYPIEVNDYEVSGYDDFIINESIEYDAMCKYIQSVKECTPHFHADNQKDEFEKLCFLKFICNTYSKSRKLEEVNDEINWTYVAELIYDNWDELQPCITLGCPRFIKVGIETVIKKDKDLRNMYEYVPTKKEIDTFFKNFNVYKFYCRKKLGK